MVRPLPRQYTTDYPQMWRSGAGVLVLAGIASGVEMLVGWNGDARYSGLQGLVLAFALAAVAWVGGPKIRPRYVPWVARVFLVGSTFSVMASVFAWRGTELAGASAFNYVLIVLFAGFYLGGLDVVALTALIGVTFWLAADTGHRGLDLLGWTFVMEVVAGIAIAVHRLSRRVTELSYRDALTGALNRRAWERALRLELAEHARRRQSLPVALVDIDYLKVVNDRNGHEAGDALLRGAVRTWATVLRDHDVVARVGGDEFGVLFVGADPAGAASLAQRLIDSLEEQLGAGCTVGIVTAPPGSTPANVLAEADRLLYQGKGEGRARLTAGVVAVAA